MVHALTECWRVLAPGGRLLDMRPRTSRPLVELVDDHGIRPAGRIDDSPGQIDDDAADRAIAAAVQLGLFSKVGEHHISFAYYWPTVAQLVAYAATCWDGYATIPWGVARHAQALAAAKRPLRARVRRTIMVAVYLKQPPPDPPAADQTDTR